MNTSRTALIRSLTDARDHHQPIYRTAAIRVEGNHDLRQFTGIGVPYGVVITHAWGPEQFAPGSVTGGDDAKLYWCHDEIIGRVLAGRDLAVGYQITARISATSRGIDAWEMVTDGTITKLSIGFIPIRWEYDEETDIVTFLEVRAVEFSLVPHPAYDTATIDPTSLRKGHHPMPAAPTASIDITATVDDLAAEVDRLSRAVALATTGPQPTTPAVAWRSMGEFLKALAAEDPDAADFHRAYTGATTADTIIADTFVGDYIKLVKQRRRIVSLFREASLPPSGLTVDYAQLKTDETKVGKQETEGADLAKGKVVLEPGSAKVETYGGWTELSLQLIQRASVPTLDTTLTALGLRYGSVTDGVVGAAVKKLESDNAADGVVVATGANADAWLDALVDVALKFEARDLAMRGLIVNPTVFKELLKLKDSDRRLMRVGFGDQVGELDISALKGDLAGITVVSSPHITRAVAFDPVAIEFRESPGAPAQLQDESIINLSKQFSVYGFCSVLAPFPKGIVPIKAA